MLKFIEEKQKQELIDTLRIRMFGSIENFEKVRDGNLKFPKQYKTVNKMILDELFSYEQLVQIINFTDKAIIFESVDQKKGIDGNGKHGESLTLKDEIESTVIIDLTRHTSGSHAKHNPWDPTVEKTYKQRLSSRLALFRRQGKCEDWIKAYAELYTEKYNEKFNTSFELYISKKRA